MTAFFPLCFGRVHSSQPCLQYGFARRLLLKTSKLTRWKNMDLVTALCFYSMLTLLRVQVGRAIVETVQFCLEPTLQHTQEGTCHETRTVTVMAAAHSSLQHVSSSWILASRSSPCSRGRPSAFSTSSRLESLYDPGQAPQPVTLSYLEEIVEPDRGNIAQDFRRRCSNSVQILGQVLLFVLLGWFIVI